MSAHDQQLSDLDHDLIADTASIFIRELPDDMCSILGHQFLTRYFLPFFLSDPSHIGLIARDNDQVAGFVLGASADRYLQKFMARHGLILAWYACLAVLRHPGKLLYFVEVMRLLLSRRSFRPATKDFELLYISVTGSRQGHGTGGKLVAGLLDRIDRGRFDRCVVKTMADNPATIRFYERLGFTPLHYNLNRVWLAIPMSNRTG